MTKSGNKEPPKQPPQFTERELQRLLRHTYRPPQRGGKGRRLRGAGGGGAREWTQNEMELLGKFSDKETARRLRRSFGSVYKTRPRLGIRAHRPLRPWTKQEARWRGQLPDAEGAPRTGRT